MSGFCAARTTSACVLLLTGLTSCARPDLFQSMQIDNSSSDVKVPYHLPQGLVRIFIERREDGGELELSIAHNVDYQPDPNHFYILDYKHSAFSSDEIVVVVDQSGFLQSICAKSKDETGTVVNKIIELATEIGKAVTGPRGASEEALPKFEYEVAFDPTNNVQRQRIIDILAEDYHVSFDIKADIVAGGIKATAENNRCLRGACFRPAQPWKIEFEYKNYETPEEREPTQGRKSVIVALPNEAPVLSIDLNRHAFVEAKTDIIFDRGMLAKVEINKPSEAVGFMNVPIDVAKAVTSIPSALLDFKITSLRDDETHYKAQSDLIDAQIDLIEDQTRLLEAQAEAMEAATKNKDD